MNKNMAGIKTKLSLKQTIAKNTEMCKMQFKPHISHITAKRIFTEHADVNHLGGQSQ